MSDKPKSQPQEKFIIRFPDGMRDRIAKAAEESGRSMNAEIVYRLDVSFETEKIIGDQAGKTVEAMEIASKWRDTVLTLEDALKYRQDEISGLHEKLAGMKSEVDRINRGIERLTALQTTKKPRK